MLHAPSVGRSFQFAPPAIPETRGAARYGRVVGGVVEILEYQPTMIHPKSMVIDGLFTLVGSSNFDSRSAEINEELDLAIYDAGFGEKMEAIFEKDLAQSKEYTLQDFKNRSLWERTTEWVALPFRSQM